MAAKWLNFGNLLKIETALSFFMSAFFSSTRVTGLVINESVKQTVSRAGIFFFVLGLIGVIGLLFSAKRKK